MLGAERGEKYLLFVQVFRLLPSPGTSPLAPSTYSPNALLSLCLLFLVIHVLQKFEKKESQISPLLLPQMISSRIAPISF